ncbi:MAG: hypothetical protein RPS47_06315, partial [Colwellia sp.]
MTTKQWFTKALSTKTLMISLLLLQAFQVNSAEVAKSIKGPYNMGSDGIVRYEDVFHPVVGKKGMVSSQNTIATEVGLDILKSGGNAIDASVAMGFAL